MTFGPLQLVTLGFGQSELPQSFVEELRRLRDANIVRLVDAVLIAKNENGDLTEIRATDFSRGEAVLLGSIAGALFGYGAAGPSGIELGAEAGMFATADGEFVLDHDDVDRITDLIPRSTCAAFILLEHLWALGLKRTVLNENGSVIAHGWITQGMLIEMGEEAAANA